MELIWKSRKNGNESATGDASNAEFSHSVIGDGNSETHTINIEYSNGKKTNIKIIGEWEFSEFKTFVSNIKTNI